MLRCTMKKIYGYHLQNGDLYLYGEMLQACIPYIEQSVNSIDDICQYCSNHNICLIYKPHNIFSGWFELIRVNRLLKKYSVRGTWKEVSKFIQK